jgi:hypothetical protein
VGIAWRSITSENVVKAFEKAKLLQYQKGIYKENYDVSMIETINESLELLGFDDPYLDDMETNYLDNSELDFENEVL